MHENVRLPFTKFVYRINKYTFAISYDINNNKKQNKTKNTVLLTLNLHNMCLTLMTV